MMPKKKKMRLGEILIEQGVLDSESLARALEKQKQEGGLLGQVLLKMGVVSEESIVIALARQFNIPYLPVQNCEIQSKVLKLVHPDLVKKNLFIPIDRIKNVLTVIMVDPTNEYAKQEIMDYTKLKLQVLVGTATEVSNAIRRHYRIGGTILEQGDPSENVSNKSFHNATSQENKNEKDVDGTV